MDTGTQGLPKEIYNKLKADFPPDYEGRVLADPPEYPEKEGPMKSWEYWERQQAKTLDWFKLGEI